MSSDIMKRNASIKSIIEVFQNQYDEQSEERRLERELEEEVQKPPQGCIDRIRCKGERILGSRPVLLLIVILNITDCVLVLGELILDIHYVKDLVEISDIESQMFLDNLQYRYPDNFQGSNIDQMHDVFGQVLKANCYWDHKDKTTSRYSTRSTSVHTTTATTDIRNTTLSSLAVTNTTNNGTDAIEVSGNENATRSTDNNGSISDSAETKSKTRKRRDSFIDRSRRDNHTTETLRQPSLKYKQAHANSIWEDIAHGLHKASIAILAALFIQVILKIICTGRRAFHKKFHVFDSFVVIFSFVVDLVFLKGLTVYRIQDGIFILSFLLPWRVIRVVNSLIVAILDHEHFRLKMLYKRQKSTFADLKIMKENVSRYREHLKRIELFCASEGIPKWKIQQHVHIHLEKSMSTVAVMASYAFSEMASGVLNGISNMSFTIADEDSSIDSGTSDMPTSYGSTLNGSKKVGFTIANEDLSSSCMSSGIRSSGDSFTENDTEIGLKGGGDKLNQNDDVRSEQIRSNNVSEIDVGMEVHICKRNAENIAFEKEL